MLSFSNKHIMAFRFMFYFILIVISFSTISATRDFKTYLSKFDLKFEGDEYSMREEIFNNNWKNIEETASKEISVTLGETQFLHLTYEEFAEYASNGRPIGVKPPLHTNVPIHYTKSLETLPPSVNWVAKGAVSPVKYQGQCGDCWAFAAVSVMESAYFIEYGSLPGDSSSSSGFKGLSEQELTACNPFSFGCNGGFQPSAYIYALNNGGLAGENEYPFVEKYYKQGTTLQCSSSGVSSIPNSAPNAQNPYTVVRKTEADFMSAVAQQPITVSINAADPIFQTYKGGIISADKCSSKEVDHAVVIVGYGTLNGVDYWILRNSWGTSWGDQGYFYIARSGNACGIYNEDASYPNYKSQSEPPTPSTKTLNKFLSSSQGAYLTAASSTKSIVITGVTLGGSAVGMGTVEASACVSTEMKCGSNCQVWAVGAVYNGATIVSNIGIFTNGGNAYAQMMGSSIEVPGYSIYPSCGALNEYLTANVESDDYNGEATDHTSIISKISTATSENGYSGVLITSVTYYINSQGEEFTSPNFVGAGFAVTLLLIAGLVTYTNLKCITHTKRATSTTSSTAAVSSSARFEAFELLSNNPQDKFEIDSSNHEFNYGTVA